MALILACGGRVGQATGSQKRGVQFMIAQRAHMPKTVGLKKAGRGRTELIIRCKSYFFIETA